MRSVQSITHTAESTPRPWALREVPVFPVNASRLIELLDDVEFQMAEAVEITRADPALAAELVRLANSPQYARRTEVVDLQECFLVLGSRNAAQAALAFVTRGYCQDAVSDPRLTGCWTHSIVTAALAEALAPQTSVPQGRAYTCGLLHDVGALALAAAFPQEYSELLSLSEELKLGRLQTERELFDLDHCRAGAYLARDWGLPSVLVEIAQTHHDPIDFADTTQSLVSRAASISERLGYSQRRNKQKAGGLLDLLSDSGFECEDDLLHQLSESLGAIRADVSASVK